MWFNRDPNYSIGQAIEPTVVRQSSDGFFICWFAHLEGTIYFSPHRPDAESHFTFETEMIFVKPCGGHPELVSP